MNPDRRLLATGPLLAYRDETRLTKANFCSDLTSVESMTYFEPGSLVRNGTDQNPVIHLYTHERLRPEAHSARVRLSNDVRAQPRPRVMSASVRADNRAA